MSSFATRIGRYGSYTAILLMLGLLGIHCVRAVEFYEGFDSRDPTWKLRYDRNQVRRVSQRRNRFIYAHGTASENIEVEAGRPGTKIRFEHKVDLARVIDGLTSEVALRSNYNGVRLAMRLILPHQTDPRTGATLSTRIYGDTYTNAPNWQLLKCSTLDELVERKLRLLRDLLYPTVIDDRDMYVDRVVLEVNLQPGTTEFFIDDLRMTGIVAPGKNTPIIQATGAADPSNAVEFQLDRLRVNGRPFFPRIMPFHGEDVAVFRRAGANVVWTPDYRDTELMRELEDFGLWAMATPPRAMAESGDVLDASAASLVPFGVRTKRIMMWILGTRIPAASRDDLLSWIQLVRNADRQFQRPIMADITGDERVYSRHLEMTGFSRHVIHTNHSFKEYRNWLMQRRKLARPGSFLWTWIQTETDVLNAAWRERAGRTPLLVEPEQIRLQTYAAIAAGCHGIGFWKTQPLDSEESGNRERLLALTQLGYELKLLEPWLATGTVSGQIPFTATTQSRNISQRDVGFGHAAASKRRLQSLLNERDSRLRSQSLSGRTLEAAKINTDYGTLILPIWYETGAQFVPGQMAAQTATIVVPQVPETASVFAVSTTKIQALRSERVEGGTKITLENFDQTAAIAITSDRNWKAKFERRMEKHQADSARVAIELAKAKIDRVRRVDAELEKLGVGQRKSPYLLREASQLIADAEAAYRQAEAEERNDAITFREGYHQARQSSRAAMQAIRILQRLHWDDAVRNRSSPLTSMHAASFQTLPDHWRMIAALGRSSIGIDDNLLPSGDFEDLTPQEMIAEGWQHGQQPVDGVTANAELALTSLRGNYALRLVALPEANEDIPAVIDQKLVSVVTPPVRVEAGQLVHISGRTRVVRPIKGSVVGATLVDSIAGRAGALHWTQPVAEETVELLQPIRPRRRHSREPAARRKQEFRDGWERFELVREVFESGDLTLTFELNGLGEIQFDDIRILALRPPNADKMADGKNQPRQPRQPRDSRPGALDFLPRLPKLRPLPTKR